MVIIVSWDYLVNIAGIGGREQWTTVNLDTFKQMRPKAITNSGVCEVFAQRFEICWTSREQGVLVHHRRSVI